MYYIFRWKVGVSGENFMDRVLQGFKGCEERWGYENDFICRKDDLRKNKVVVLTHDTQFFGNMDDLEYFIDTSLNAGYSFRLIRDYVTDECDISKVCEILEP